MIFKTTQEIRRDNVSRLIREDFQGVKGHFADHIGVPRNTVSRWFGKSEHSRDISDDVARHIEKSCGKPIGWLDNPHPDPEDEELSAQFQAAKRVDPEGLAYALQLLLREKS